MCSVFALSFDIYANDLHNLVYINIKPEELQYIELYTMTHRILKVAIECIFAINMIESTYYKCEVDGKTITLFYKITNTPISCKCYDTWFQIFEVLTDGACDTYLEGDAIFKNDKYASFNHELMFAPCSMDVIPEDKIDLIIEAVTQRGNTSVRDIIDYHDVTILYMIY